MQRRVSPQSDDLYRRREGGIKVRTVRSALLVMLQAASHGPPPGAEVRVASERECAPVTVNEIAVCGRAAPAPGQRLAPIGAPASPMLDEAGLLNLGLGSTGNLGGGGPMGKNGQSVGATLRIRF